MKYWFIIKQPLSEEVAQGLWDKIVPYHANLTVLFDRAYIYGDADEPYTVECIANILVESGLPVERG